MSVVGHTNFYFLYSEFLGLKAPFPLLFVLGSSALYLFCVYVLFPATAPVTEAQKNAASVWRYRHNVALCLFSLICFVGSLYHLIVSGELYSLQPMVCNPIPEWLWTLYLVFTFSKIWEWADTMFLVWFKGTQNLDFLHVYHHTTTFWLYLHMGTLPGMLKMAICLNGLVHTLMYAHYAHPFPRWLVPWITRSQIVQLAFGTWVWHITPDTCPRYATFHKDHPYDFLTPYSMAPVYLLFFLKLYVERFLFGKGKKGSKKTE